MRGIRCGGMCSRTSPRHCEEPLRRSNPVCHRRDSLDCFAALAMTECVERARGRPAYSSLPRVIAMDASVLVRVHSMLRRR
ncbi:hypothetical protein FXB41_36355 [Bradyrhizobium canariense]|nr:hypothetical protein [Bradyrhizobium canariense]